jgi:Fe-S-cluster containining protein
MSESGDLPGGVFSTWLRNTRVALAADVEADVPCGECSACCMTSHFVHVGLEETRTLARIPRELLFPAPGLPVGNVLLGYDDQGRCPMLTGDRCSIYEDRPLTCRTYDCRVFAAAGTAADADPITRQARRWRFSHPTREDRHEHEAVRAAARFLRERAECFPGGDAPRDPVRVALLAIRVYEVFLAPEVESGAAGRAPSDLDIAKSVMAANERFEMARLAAHTPPGVVPA